MLWSGRRFSSLLSAVMGKVEDVPDELDDLAKEISRQGAESATWLLFAPHSKM